MGGAWPVGDFSVDNPELDGIGYANKGFALTIDANYSVTPSFAITGMLFWGTNTVNQGAVGTKLENQLFEFFDPSEINNDYLLFNVDYWFWGSALFGPKYSIKFNKLFWDFHVLGGPNITHLPKQSLIYDDPEENWFYQDRLIRKSDFSMAWLAGTDIRFAVSNKINLKLGVSYYHTKATMETEQIIVNKDDVDAVELLDTNETKIPISTINATIGFVYMFE
jgi:hypothetical protein